MNKPTELLPCPFHMEGCCPKVEHRKHYAHGPRAYSVSCDNHKGFISIVAYGVTEKEAIHVWNTRPASSAGVAGDALSRDEVKKAIYKAWVTNKPETFGEAMDHATDEVMALIEEATLSREQPDGDACQHEWVCADNEHVHGASICLKCKTIVATTTLTREQAVQIEGLEIAIKRLEFGGVYEEAKADKELVLEAARRYAASPPTAQRGNGDEG